MDMVLIQKAKLLQVTHLLHQAWLGGLVRGSSNIVVRQVVGEVKGPWLLALGHVPDTTAIVWPAKEITDRASGEIFYELERDIKDIRDCYIAVLDHERWEAQRVEWRSPYSQAR